MDQPVILVVDDDTDTLHAVEVELDDRYGRHYRIECIESPADACSRLHELRAAAVEVALVLCAQWLPGLTGSEVLEHAHRTHPKARRALLVDWASGACGDR